MRRCINMRNAKAAGVPNGLGGRGAFVEKTIMLLYPTASGINIIRGKAGFPNGGSRFL